MKRLWGKLGRWLVPGSGILAAGLTVFLVITPAGAAAAQGPTRVFYDAPGSGLESTSAYSIGAQWDKNEVTYNFMNCPANVACDVAQQQVREAVEAWDVVSGITLNEVGSEGDIRIGWYVGEHGDGNPFDGPGNVLAHAFFPLPFLGDLAGDVHLDDTETWVFDTPTAPRQVHLKTTAMHEVGHSLGLEHSSDPTSLMWAEYTGVKGLGPDDIAGIQALYGQPSPDEGGPAASPAPPSSVTATATTTVRVRSGPGTDFAQVGSIDVGVTVPVYGKNPAGDWLYVDINGLRGWVATFLFRVNGDLNTIPVVDNNGGGAEVPTAAPTDPGNPPPQPTIAPVNPGTLSGVTLSTVRLRSGPGTNYPPVGAIDGGTTVTLLARSGSSQWVYIEYQGLRGWVAAWLVQINGDVNTLPVMQPIF